MAFSLNEVCNAAGFPDAAAARTRNPRAIPRETRCILPSLDHHLRPDIRWFFGMVDWSLDERRDTWQINVRLSHCI